MRCQKRVKWTQELLKKEVPCPQTKCSQEACETTQPTLNPRPVERGEFSFNHCWSDSSLHNRCCNVQKSHAVSAHQEGSSGLLSDQLNREMSLFKLTWALATCCPCATSNARESWLSWKQRQAPTSRAHPVVIALWGLPTSPLGS